MALIVNVKCAENLRGKADRLLKVTFRGNTHSSKVLPGIKRVAYFGETFEWPVARAAKEHEEVVFELFNYNKYRSNKLIGTLTLVMQYLVQQGHVNVAEAMVNDNNRATEEVLIFEARYFSPDGHVGHWDTHEFDYPVIQQIDENTGPVTEVTSGKRKHSLAFDETETLWSMTNDEMQQEDLIITGQPEGMSGAEDAASATMMVEQLYKGTGKRPEAVEHKTNKKRHFQVCVTVIEAMQLAGLDINPIVQVQVGEELKYTTIKKSTNTPFFNEDMIFKFFDSPAEIFDKVIIITVLHSKTIFGQHIPAKGSIVYGRVIGFFRCDVGTVYSAPNHGYFHKWAVLLDPKNLSQEPKGYVRCNISVVGQGDVLRVPKARDSDTKDLEGNLLLPVGVKKLQQLQRAAYKIIIYRGEDLPRTDLGVIATVRKALPGGKTRAFVDAFVKVSFGGNVGKTSSKKAYHPEWREELTFVDIFPPLCNRIKVQVCDKDVTSDDNIATHFIELAQITDPSADGEAILPNYGPNYINMYGAPRAFKLITEHDELNDGTGEGVAYRGRILLSIKTQLLDREDPTPAGVSKGKLRTSARIEVAPRREFFLFCSLFEASLIDKELKDKKIYFEISMGQFGNVLDEDGLKDTVDRGEEDEEENEDESQLLLRRKQDEAKIVSRSTTPPMIPQPMDKTDNYYYLPLNGKKPCTYVIGMFEDLRKRLYNSNILVKCLDKLEDGLDDVRHLMTDDDSIIAPRRLRGVLNEFCRNAEAYMKHNATFVVGAGSGKTKLDKSRLKMCKTAMDKLKTRAEELKRKCNKDNIRSSYNSSRDISRRLRHLAKEPQDSLPDIFIWMIHDKKRIAYYRLPAKDIIHHSAEESLQGKKCGKVNTIFIRRPGKMHEGAGGWVVQAKLELYMWLGLNEKKTYARVGTRIEVPDYLKTVPVGYDITDEMRATEEPPEVLVYPEHFRFQLRAYIYQARALLGCDSSGLSDPFARVILANKVKETQYIKETLNPTWNATIALNDLEIYSPLDIIITNPPMVIVELFDYDSVGSPEFLGRTVARPNVLAATQPYEIPDFPPQLSWWEIHRGPRKAGELLASFELLQLTDTVVLPPLPVPPADENRSSVFANAFKAMGGGSSVEAIHNIPETIKPVLRKFRLEVLFWGVRELRRVQMLSVSRPKVMIEVAGQFVRSTIVADIDINSNFDDPVQWIDLMLPENEIFWPPLNMRLFDHRRLATETLVGVATVGNLFKYKWIPQSEREKKEEERLQKIQKAFTPITVQKEGQNGVPPQTTIPIGAPPVISIEGATNPQLGTKDNGSGKVNGSLARAPGTTGATVVTVSTTAGGLGTITNGPVIGPDGAVVPVVPIGQMPTSQTGVPPGASEEEIKQAQQKKMKHRRELIADLDWWSKYYVTREDISKEAKDFVEEASVDYFPTALDFQSLDEVRLEELKEEAKQKRLQVESEMDKKQKKKLEKKRKKEKRKSRFENLRGYINMAFSTEDDELDMEAEGIDEDDMEDKSFIERITIYNSELENVPAFEGFTDWLDTFELFRGKTLADDDDDDTGRVAGRFKGRICIYPIRDDEPPPVKNVSFTEKDQKPGNKRQSVKKSTLVTKTTPETELKLLRGLPSNRPQKVNILLYIIKAENLTPMDLNGKADPYLVVQLGNQEKNTRQDRLHNTLDPVFGRMFEFEATFPMESILKIAVMDYDLIPPDDLIGQTEIDLENRVLSKYRATCGIQKKYELFGYNIWRDSLKPTEIVAKLCRDVNVHPPEYTGNRARFAGNSYIGEENVELENGDMVPTKEHVALEILKNWEGVPKGSPLVMEHIEVRSLNNPDSPGVEQGRLEMWVDLFPADNPAPSYTVDVTPRQPKGYELRVIVWNTDDVKLQDVNFITGEASSDIYVRGYVKGKGEDDQKTDIHYRSLTGEGNFNWRFLFPFEYLRAEERVVYYKKLGVFDLAETEIKTPAILSLQVWDADLIMSDDYLGYICLDLNRMPRPSKNAKSIRPNNISYWLKDGTSMAKKWPTLNLFKQKQCKGWYPVVAKDKEGEQELAGKIEVEIRLVTAEEAEASPVGLGRSDPEALQEPNRPDTSFLWLFNPMKTFKYIFWRNFRWKILKISIFLAFAFLFVLFIYNVPQALVFRILSIGKN